MIVKHGKYKVDVSRKDCIKRDCFWLGFNKGTFSQGRGYTSYYEKPIPVCWERHMRGCPINSVCPICRSAGVDSVGSECRSPICDGITIER
jgi:hypothetical protein